MYSELARLTVRSDVTSKPQSKQLNQALTIANQQRGSPAIFFFLLLYKCLSPKTTGRPNFLPIPIPIPTPHALHQPLHPTPPPTPRTKIIISLSLSLQPRWPYILTITSINRQVHRILPLPSTSRRILIYLRMMIFRRLFRGKGG